MCNVIRHYSCLFKQNSISQYPEPQTPTPHNFDDNFTSLPDFVNLLVDVPLVL